MYLFGKTVPVKAFEADVFTSITEPFWGLLKLLCIRERPFSLLFYGGQTG